MHDSQGHLETFGIWRKFMRFFFRSGKRGTNPRWEKKILKPPPHPPAKKKSFVIALLSSCVTRIRASLALAFVRLKKQKNYTCSEG